MAGFIGAASLGDYRIDEYEQVHVPNTWFPAVTTLFGVENVSRYAVLVTWESYDFTVSGDSNADDAAMQATVHFTYNLFL